ncbi:MAG TPA: PP2C family serine/threonine-protein phosphatase [Ktedonobacteraceae bacterium]|nr:PP2C family serine/threonine-protein phosphatase [Ktedonobacteraceae bacterium]
MTTSPLRRQPSFSEHCYELLLQIYPREFRRAFRLEMMQTFRDCYREALRENGQPGVIRLWGSILYDLATTALIEHVREFVTKLKGKETITMVNQFSLNVAQLTDIGRKRESNEDNMISIVPDDIQVMTRKGALFVVADGLGGHTKGEVASEMTVKLVREAYYQDENDDIAASLRHAVEHANVLIYQANQAQIEPSDKDHMMGSTCVAAVLQGDTVYVANVGDSRAYIVRAGLVKQVSQDHTPEAEQMRAGLLTEEQARAQSGNKITRCMGIKPDVEVDVFTEPVQQSDILVLCTDGLSKTISDEQMGKIVQQFEPQESVQRLIELANEQGGPDNITAVVARVSQALN